MYLCRRTVVISGHGEVQGDVLGLAARHEAIPKNPVREAKRMKKPLSEAVSLTHDQVEAIRGAARAWRCGPGVPGPPPDGQLEQIIEVMLGTSARIGEGLAIRKCDVDVTRTPSTVLICGTIVSPKGRPIVRQPHPEDDVVDQAGVDPELHGGCSAGAAGIKLSAAVDPVPRASTCPSRGACSAVRRHPCTPLWSACVAAARVSRGRAPGVPPICNVCGCWSCRAGNSGVGRHGRSFWCRSQ